MQQIDHIDEKVVMFLTHNDVVQKRGNLCEATRKWWRCSQERVMEADYVFSIIDGEVKEVYKVTGYHEEYDDGTAYPSFNGKRLVLDLILAPDYIRTKYKDKILPSEYKPWGQNPVRYNF